MFQNGVLVSGLSVTPSLILNYFMNVLICPIFTNCSEPHQCNMQQASANGREMGRGVSIVLMLWGRTRELKRAAKRATS